MELMILIHGIIHPPTHPQFIASFMELIMPNSSARLCNYSSPSSHAITQVHLMELFIPNSGYHSDPNSSPTSHAITQLPTYGMIHPQVMFPTQTPTHGINHSRIIASLRPQLRSSLIPSSFPSSCHHTFPSPRNYSSTNISSNSCPNLWN